MTIQEFLRVLDAPIPEYQDLFVNHGSSSRGSLLSVLHGEGAVFSQANDCEETKVLTTLLGGRYVSSDGDEMRAMA